MAHFEIKDLTFAYAAAKDRPALKDVTLSVGRGEYMVLCGRSGSGKTTLLRHLKPGRRRGAIRELIDDLIVFQLFQIVVHNSILLRIFPLVNWV